MKPLDPAIDRVLEQLQRVKANSTGWSACCPAHDDRNPSLSIAVGSDGQVLLKCHAGCATGDIVQALRLEMRDLFEPGTGNGAHRNGSTATQQPKSPPIYPTADAAIAAVLKFMGKGWVATATYAYRGRDGQEVAQVVRLDPVGEGKKEFRPLNKLADGRWRIGAPRPWPLYRLPEVADQPVVYLCEGEKSADAAAALGLPATASAGGAGAPSKTDFSPLAGKLVVILPDHDEPGERYARDATANLHGLQPPATVKVVRLPGLAEHEDIVEYTARRKKEGLDDGKVRAEVEDLARQAPVVSVVSGVPKGFPEKQWPLPQPLGDELPPVPAFDYGLLPDNLAGWIQDIAERIQCPPDFPAVSAMVALGGVVGRKVCIRPKRQDDWRVVPNIWGAAIGRPGVLKTPAILEPLKPLRRLELRGKEAFEDATRRYEAKAMVAEVRKKDSTKFIRDSLKKGGDGLAAAEEVLEDQPEEPTRRRYIVNDSSVEKLGEILNENPNGVTCYRDELTGLLFSLDKEGQEGARAFYLEAWNGDGRYTYDRIGRGTIDIEAAIVSIIGSIQPGPLHAYLRHAVGQTAQDDGLMQRFQLAVWPDISKQWVNVDRWPDSEARERALEIFEWLDQLDPLAVGATVDEKDPREIPSLQFSADAQEVFDAWREALERRVRSGDEHPAMESHLAKYRSLVPSLALLIALVDGECGSVGEGPLRKALRWAEYLEAHARRIYSVAISSDVASAKALALKLQQRKLPDVFVMRDVYRPCWSKLASPDEARRAVQVLIEHDWLEETTGEGGRLAYRVNPRVHEAPGEGTDKADKEDEDGDLSVKSVPTPEPVNAQAQANGADWGWI